MISLCFYVHDERYVMVPGMARNDVHDERYIMIASDENTVLKP
jgi:hypothetical protein